MHNFCKSHHKSQKEGNDRLTSSIQDFIIFWHQITEVIDLLDWCTICADYAQTDEEYGCRGGDDSR